MSRPYRARGADLATAALVGALAYGVVTGKGMMAGDPAVVEMGSSLCDAEGGENENKRSGQLHSRKLE